MWIKMSSSEGNKLKSPDADIGKNTVLNIGCI